MRGPRCDDSSAPGFKFLKTPMQRCSSMRPLSRRRLPSSGIQRCARLCFPHCFAAWRDALSSGGLQRRSVKVSVHLNRMLGPATCCEKSKPRRAMAVLSRFQVECFIFSSSHDLKCSNRIQLKTKFVNRQERNAWVRLPNRSDLISETLMTKSMESTLRPLVFAAKQSHHFRFSRRVATHPIAFCN